MLHRLVLAETRFLKFFMLAAVGEDVVLVVRNFNETCLVVEKLLRVKEKAFIPIVEHSPSGSLATYPPLNAAKPGRIAIVTAAQIAELQEEHEEVVKKSKKRQREEAQGLIRDLAEQLRGLVKGTPTPASYPAAPAPVADRLLQVTFPFAPAQE